jgi:hypothetical protein
MTRQIGRQTGRKIDGEKDRQKYIIVYKIKIEIFNKNEQATYPSEVI